MHFYQLSNDSVRQLFYLPTPPTTTYFSHLHSIPISSIDRNRLYHPCLLLAERRQFWQCLDRWKFALTHYGCFRLRGEGLPTKTCCSPRCSSSPKWCPSTTHSPRLSRSHQQHMLGHWPNRRTFDSSRTDSSFWVAYEPQEFESNLWCCHLQFATYEEPCWPNLWSASICWWFVQSLHCFGWTCWPRAAFDA